MNKTALKVQIREGRGKGPARGLRREGRIPGIIYGVGEPTPISLDSKELSRIITSGDGGSKLLSIVMEGKEKMAILRDYQVDPVKNVLIHADLQEVAEDKPVHVTVAVVQVGGQPAGVKEGGILSHAVRDIVVECLPSKIPEHIEVDCSGLKINESVHVGNLKLPDGVKALTDAGTVLFAVAPPISAEKLDAMLSSEAAAEVKEPEVLTKKKEEEEKPEKAKTEKAKTEKAK
ncbi:MAG: 50S ribosomal protein L25 [Nitrospirota bacterium]